MPSIIRESYPPRKLIATRIRMGGGCGSADLHRCGQICRPNWNLATPTTLAPVHSLSGAAGRKVQEGSVIAFQSEVRACAGERSPLGDDVT